MAGGGETLASMTQRPATALSRTQGGPAKIREAFVPPKPKELERAKRTLRSLACFGTRSMSQEGDGSSRLRVGGTTPSRIVRIGEMASTLPAATRRWPV